MLCPYGAGSQDEAYFAPALLIALEEEVVTANSADPSTSKRNWGTLDALMQSALRASVGSMVGGASAITSRSNKNYSRTWYVPAGTEEEVRFVNGCVDATCGNPAKEFNTCINNHVEVSFCIDQDTIRRMPPEASLPVTVTLDSGRQISIPRIIIRTFQSKLIGLLQGLDRQVLLEMISAVGNNVITGNSAPYSFPVTSSFFGNTIIDAGGQALQNIHDLNNLGRMLIVGDGNFANYVASLRAARAATNYGTFQPALIEGLFEFFRDPLTETLLGPDQVLAIDEGKAQFIFHTVKGTPTWKQGVAFDPNVPESLTGIAATNETSISPEKMSFTLPVYQLPGFAVDVEMTKTACVNNITGNDGWQVKMFADWGIFKLPADFYAPTDQLNGNTHVLLLETVAA